MRQLPLVVLVVKNSPANAGDPGSLPGLGRYPEEGNGDRLQCSCLGNCMDREAWWATVYESDTTKRLAISTFTFPHW